MKSAQRRLEHENEDLRFLNDEYLARLRTVETESAAKSERIQLLQEKNLQAIVHTGSLDSYSYSYINYLELWLIVYEQIKINIFY